MSAHSTILEVFTEDNATGVALKNKALKRAIINYLDQHGETTITELTQELNISIPKTTSLINELMVEELIRDYGKIDSTGGRRASLYGLAPEAAYFIGVDIKRYYINIGLLDFKKNLVSVNKQIPYQLENTEESYQELLRIIRNFINTMPVAKEKVLALGINIAGRINTATGFNFNFFHFHEESLSTTLEKELGIRTYLENDARSAAFGEMSNGVVTTEKNVLYVYLDYGIGMGIFIDGKLYYGKSGYSGEFGHIPIFYNEIICHCGKKGCLETEASGQALVKLFREKIEQGSSSVLLKKLKGMDELRLRDIVDAAQKEDVLSIELIAAIGEKIGKALAILINIFNPEMVILGGTMAETGDYIRLPIRSALNKYSLSLVNSDSTLALSVLGEDAGVIGGCLIARSKLLRTI
ncbi:ROK family transcriptional regulator [Flavihumibacter rivuli]|uniref:ROK family transcriptional regulator n=1 Tax=Flavihumibacter rivuli TaxID=2838156 RepID=UPI001BDE812F|nr:ROK family transcriptional regulator [Flavihumibacter rivuli]ULQ55768.1 ROK family transcriptional regulator [Flavihumibacter rivuli]